MTDKPTLEAILKLDAAQFKTNIDGARAKANSFSAKMGDMKQGVNGVSKAMGGLHAMSGMATGSLGGMARMMSGLVTSFNADPVYAMVAAIAALAAAVGSYVENQAKSMLEATKKQVEIYKQQRSIFREASGRYGMTPWGRAGSQAEEAIGKKDFAGAAAVRSGITADIAKVESEINAMKYKAFDEKDPTGAKAEQRRQDLYRQLEIHKRKLKEVDNEYAKLGESGRKAVETDIENDQYREEQRAKLREDGRKSVSEDMEKGWKEFETAEKKKAGLKSDLESGLRDIRAGKGLHLSSPVADSMAKMGGYIGAQADPGARARERQSQMAAEVRNLVAEIRDKLNEVVE